MASVVGGLARLNVYSLSMIWRKNLDGAHNRGHKQTDLIIMNFAKAFDKVLHRRLAYELKYYGIRNDILLWITTWLSGRTQWPELQERRLQASLSFFYKFTQ